MATTPPDRPPVQTIDRDALRARLAENERLKLVMTLNEWGFRAKHIPGSLHFSTPRDMMAALHEDDEIVVYCSNLDCHASVAAYYALLDHGYRHVRRYAGGLVDWEEAGLPLEGDWAPSGANAG